MPTVLRIKGYRIGFFSSDFDEPPHVHVDKGGHTAKFWLDPLQLGKNAGFRGASWVKFMTSCAGIGRNF